MDRSIHEIEEIDGIIENEKRSLKHKLYKKTNKLKLKNNSVKSPKEA